MVKLGMRHRAAVVLLVCCGLSEGRAALASVEPPAASDAASASRVFSREDVRADLTELLDAFRDLHPNPFWSRSESQLRRDVESIVEDVPAAGFPERELFERAAKLVIAIDDPHCWVFAPGWDDYKARGGVVFPMRLKFRDGAALVEIVSLGAGVEKGARVTAINGVPMGDLYRQLRPLTGQADDAFGDEFLSTFFARYVWFFRGWTGSFKVTVMPDGAGSHERTVELAGVTAAQWGEVVKQVESEDVLVLRMLEPGSALIEFRSCPEDGRVRAQAEPIFRKLREAGVERVLIDARDNTGGGDGAWKSLLEFLTDKPYSAYRGSSFRITARLRALVGEEGLRMGYGDEAAGAADGTVFERTTDRSEWTVPEPEPLRFTGRWAVLSGAGVFSSGMSFVNAVKACGLAPVVGQNTGGRSKGFGQWVKVTLPRSGFAVAVSTKQFDGAVDVPLRHTVPPDVFVMEGPIQLMGTADDPVVKAALELLRAPQR
jgi:hypothetical protein